MHYFEGIYLQLLKNDMNYDMYDTRELKERELQIRTSKKFKLIVSWCMVHLVCIFCSIT